MVCFSEFLFVTMTFSCLHYFFQNLGSWGCSYFPVTFLLETLCWPLRPLLGCPHIVTVPTRLLGQTTLPAPCGCPVLAYTFILLCYIFILHLYFAEKYPPNYKIECGGESFQSLLSFNHLKDPEWWILAQKLFFHWLLFPPCHTCEQLQSLSRQ